MSRSSKVNKKGMAPMASSDSTRENTNNVADDVSDYTS